MTRSPHRLEPVSATFHGRDIFAPVAAVGPIFPRPVAAALAVAKPRKRTKPSRAAKEKRLSEKKRRGETKAARRKDSFD